jgi:hypothetical protein
MRMPSGVKGDRGGKWSSDLVLDLYSNLLIEIWEVVSALIGEAILALLFNTGREISFLDISESI